MCPWVGSHAPSCGGQFWGLLRRMEYPSPQGVLLPRVYSTTASLLWLELRGHAAWQAALSWAVCRHACHHLLPWLRATVAMVPDAACPGLGPVALEYCSCHWPGGSAGSPQCVRSWVYRPLRPAPLLPSLHVRVRCPGELGACSPVRALCVVCVCCWWLPPSSSLPHNFDFFLFFCSGMVSFCFAFFCENGKGGMCTLQAQA